jgi:mRNA interferase MazF
MVIRGDIWWADFGAPKGSRPALARPVLIISADYFNESPIRTLIVAAITSNVRLALAPGNVFLKAKSTGLPRDSVVNVSSIASIHKDELKERCGTTTAEQMRAVDDGLRRVLALVQTT